jgi:Protein phosphatase 2C
MSMFCGDSADGRPRLLGELMLSRAIGDLPYRTLGLTAEPEFSTWRNISSGVCLSVRTQVAVLLMCASGDRFLILASDGLLEKLSPAEVCATAAAVADSRPLPFKPQQQPAAIPLGPVNIKAAAPASAALPVDDQQQLARSTPCRPKQGLVACEDCCGAEQQRAPRKAQQIAETLQQTAYDRTALDNIVVLVIPLQRCGHPGGALST